MHALSRFIASLSHLVEAHTVELRYEAQRLASDILVRLAIFILLLTGVGLVLAGVFHLLISQLGVPGACLVTGVICSMLGTGVWIWHAMRLAMARDGRRRWTMPDDNC